MPEQPINEQTRQMMGMPTSGDPAIIDPTTGRPYTPDASMRQQEEITRQAEVKEEFVSEQRLQLPKDLEEEIEEQIRPKARPEGLPNVYEKNTAIDKTLEYGYLLKERQPGAKGKTRIVTGLDERDPAQQRIIKSFFDTAVGGDTGFDPTKQAWCAAFVNHILTEMGADLIESKDPYKRLRANEYKTYGKPVDLENIQEGDIVVFDFDKDGTADHVTFYAGGRITSQGEGQYINVIGGNQGGGEVSIRENEPGYTLDNVAAIRRVTYDGDAYEIAQSHKDSDPIFKTFLPEEHEDYALNLQGNYNKGGAVMNEQMEMAFMQEGGLKDDGMDQDPVSGNEVPNGSMAKEVRDDISAQLSEGEYVVPADVVRYLGVKHFEDLRDKAKQGLQSMEANGRIGGEPVPVGGPQAASMMQPPMPQAPTPYSPQPAPMAPPQMAMGGDLSPEEMNEINSIMMAQGGMVPTDPYQQQQMQYTQPMAQGLDVGGPVVQPPAVPEIPQVSPYSSFTPSGNFSWENSVSITDTEVPVENEASCEARGLVYNLDTKMCEEPETPVIETPVVGGDDSSPSSDQAPTATPWYENTNWSTEGVQSSIDKYFGKESKFGSGISSVIGGVLGGIPGAAVGRYGAQVANLSTARAEIEIRKAMGDTAGAEALQKAVDDQLKASAGLGKADEIVNAFFGSDGDMKVIEDLKAAGINVDSALRDDKLDAFLSNLSLSDKTRLQKFHNFTPGKPVKAAADKPAVDKVDPSRTFKTSGKDTRSETVALKARVDDDRESFAERIQKEAKAFADKAADTGKSIAEVGREKAPSSEAKTETEKAAAEGDPRAGMYNKGGLMKKKRKK